MLIRTAAVPVGGERVGVATRLVVGAIAGFVGTMPMTAAMRRLHRRLPPAERYPLTPRELVDTAAAPSNPAAKDLAVVGHFGYGAVVGALIGAAAPRLSTAGGAAVGAGVWLASYMGWIPAARLLQPATRHPPRRNLLMIGVHLIWGAVTAWSMRELLAARATIFSGGEDRDAAGRSPPSG